MHALRLDAASATHTLSRQARDGVQPAELQGTEGGVVQMLADSSSQQSPVTPNRSELAPRLLLVSLLLASQILCDPRGGSIPLPKCESTEYYLS